MSAMAKAGRYEIIGELGRGAMGVVYKAVDPVIGRAVAVKTIRLSEEGTGMTRAELLQRFQTEAHAAGLLTHPNIVVVYDAGEEDGLFYITMELVEGKSLQNLLDSGQVFPLPRVMRIAEQACEALQYAHERNIVHRDVKPANLMLTADDTLKITDFGTAKILQFGTTHQTAHVIGTPSYMSPEQVKGRPVDGRSDIFSMGVVLYEMVTGEKPFPGQNITTVIYKIVNEDPVPPREIDPSIHPGINQVVMKALAKAPDARYQSCRDMIGDLKNFRSLAGTAESTVALPGVGLTSGVALHEKDGGKPTLPGGRVLAAARRTGSIRPLQAGKKKSRTANAALAIVLLGIIGYCSYRVKPYMLELWQRMHAPQDSVGDTITPSRSAATSPSAASTAGLSSSNATASPSVAVTPNAGGNTNSAAAPPPVEEETRTVEHATPEALKAATKEAAPAPSVAPAKSREHRKPEGSSSTAKPQAPANLAPGLSLAAAEFRGRLEQALQDAGLTDRVKLEGMANTLTFSGKLKPVEYRELLKRLREAPAGVQIVDHIEFDDTPETANADANSIERAVPRPGLGGIRVKTDVIGATAMLRGPHGRELEECQTPCGFNDLFPAWYSLEVRKEGYRPVETALQVKPAEVLEQKVTLEAVAMGLFVTSVPAGADVFINGAKQSGQTPVALPLAPGPYNIVLRKEGYEAYVGQVRVQGNAQTQLNAELTAKTEHVAWVTVTSQPRGAEIIVDGTATGQTTPARVRMTAGLHTVTLQYAGYVPLVRKVAVDEGQTVEVTGPMRPK
jgi:serine/threonine protein kinase